MRHRFVILLTLASAACAHGPVSYTSVTPQPAETAFGCALRKVNELGYTVTNSSTEGRFIAAEKNRTSTFGHLFSNREAHDQLTVSIFDGRDSSRTIRVTAGSTSTASGLVSQKTDVTEPSKEGKQAATDLLTACGSGPINSAASGRTVERTAFGH